MHTRDFGTRHFNSPGSLRSTMASSQDSKLWKRTNGEAKKGDEVVLYKSITTTAEGRKKDELLDQHFS